jgi:hypothetical protein
MSDKKAKEIIDLQEREEKKQSNFRNLWQETADLMFTRENQIVDRTTPGEEKNLMIYDTTAPMASNEMASGLSVNLVPPGQRFFAVKALDREINELESVKMYLSLAAEIAHDEIFSSNFMLQLNETLKSLVTFGTGNLYSEYLTGLNFKDFDVAAYQILENSEGRVDGMILKYPYTARQMVQEFGEDKIPDAVKRAYKDPKDSEKEFTIVHVTRPRDDRNPLMRDFLNMPFESIYVCKEEIATIDEGGFEEFPFHVPRWAKSSREKHGRGVGTEILPQVRVLNRMVEDLIEMANKWANPPLEVLESFEGEVSVIPGATNFVIERDSIRSINPSAMGSFPVSKDIVEMQREIVKKAFFNDVFVQLTDLKGDRRTTLEIQERIREGLQRLGPPIGRLYAELFSPMIVRILKMLIRWGRIPYPPQELQGQGFGIEYVGPLALALRNQQIRGFQQWLGVIAEMEDIFPGSKDNVNADVAIRDIGHSFGVKPEHMMPKKKMEDIRKARAEKLAQQEAMQQAALAAQSYQQTTKAPEEGSGAESMQELANA